MSSIHFCFISLELFIVYYLLLFVPTSSDLTLLPRYLPRQLDQAPSSTNLLYVFQVITMARWHVTSCAEPDIEVLDGIPHCRKCGANSKFRLKELVDEAETRHREGSPSSIRIAEQEETTGQMNLYWPRSVNWSPGPLRADAVSSVQGQDEEGSSNHAAQTIENLMAPPYEAVLESHQFRLMCLYPSQHNQNPIHVGLKAYDRERCPEYHRAPPP